MAGAFLESSIEYENSDVQAMLQRLLNVTGNLKPGSGHRRKLVIKPRQPF